MKPAGFWVRFAAVFIDGLLFLPFTGANSVATHYGYRDFAIVSLALGTIFGAVYSVWCHHRYEQTVGKYLLDLRVLPIEGRQISLVQSCLRSSVDIGISLLSAGVSICLMLSVTSEDFTKDRWSQLVLHSPSVWAVGVLGFLWGTATVISVLAQPEKKALHDLIAGTKVVRFADQRPAAMELPGPTG